MILELAWILLFAVENALAQQRTIKYYIADDKQVRLDPVADLLLKPTTIQTNATLFPSAISPLTPNLEYSVRTVPDNVNVFTALVDPNIQSHPSVLFQTQMDNVASKQSEIWYHRQDKIYSSGRILKKPFNFEFTNELKKGEGFQNRICYFATKLLEKEVVFCRERQPAPDSSKMSWAIYSETNLNTRTAELNPTIYEPNLEFTPSFQVGYLNIKSEYIVFVDMDKNGIGYIFIAGPESTVVTDPLKRFKLRRFATTADFVNEKVNHFVSISTYSKSTLGLSGLMIVGRRPLPLQPLTTPSNVGNVLFKDDELVNFLNGVVTTTPLKVIWNGGSPAFFWMAVYGESGVNTFGLAVALEKWGVSYNLFQMPGTEIPTTPTEFKTIAIFQASMAIFANAHCRFTHNLRNRIMTACWTTSYLKSDVCFMIDIFQIRPNEPYQTSLVFVKRVYGAFTGYGFDIDADSLNQTGIVRMVATTTDHQPGNFYLHYKNHFIFSYLLSNDWYSVDFSRVLDTVKGVTNVDISPILNTSYPYQILIQNVTSAATVVTFLPRMTKPIVNFLRNELVQLDFLNERNCMGHIPKLATKSPEYTNIVAKINRIPLGPQEIMIGEFLLTFGVKGLNPVYTLRQIFLKVSVTFSFELGEIIGEFGPSTDPNVINMMRNWNWGNFQKAVMMENSIYLFFRETDSVTAQFTHGAFRLSTWKNDPNKMEIWTPVNKFNEIAFFETRERMLRIELDTNLRRRILIFVSIAKNFSSFPSQPSHFIDIPGVMRSISDISIKPLPSVGRFQITLLYTHNVNMTGTTSNTFMVVEKYSFDRSFRELTMRYVIEKTLELKPNLSYKTCIFEDSVVLSTYDMTAQSSEIRVFSVLHGSSYPLDPSPNDNRLFCDQDYVIVASNITVANPSASNTISIYRLGTATRSVQRKVHADPNATFRDANFKFAVTPAFLTYKHLEGADINGVTLLQKRRHRYYIKIDSDKTISSPIEMPQDADGNKSPFVLLSNIMVGPWIGSVSTTYFGTEQIAEQQKIVYDFTARLTYDIEKTFFFKGNSFRLELSGGSSKLMLQTRTNQTTTISLLSPNNRCEFSAKGVKMVIVDSGVMVKFENSDERNCFELISFQSEGAANPIGTIADIEVTSETNPFQALYSCQLTRDSLAPFHSSSNSYLLACLQGTGAAKKIAIYLLVLSLNSKSKLLISPAVGSDISEFKVMLAAQNIYVSYYSYPDRLTYYASESLLITASKPVSWLSSASTSFDLFYLNDNQNLTTGFHVMLCQIHPVNLDVYTMEGFKVSNSDVTKFTMDGQPFAFPVNNHPSQALSVLSVLYALPGQSQLTNMMVMAQTGIYQRNGFWFEFKATGSQEFIKFVPPIGDFETTYVKVHHSRGEVVFVSNNYSPSTGKKYVVIYKFNFDSKQRNGTLTFNDYKTTELVVVESIEITPSWFPDQPDNNIAFYNINQAEFIAFRVADEVRVYKLQNISIVIDPQVPFSDIARSKLVFKNEKNVEVHSISLTQFFREKRAVTYMWLYILLAVVGFTLVLVVVYLIFKKKNVDLESELSSKIDKETEIM